MEINTTIVGDSIKTLKKFPDNSINCCVTSVPYYKLRDYGHKEQIGLEKTPEQYVKKLVKVFEQVRRVLKPNGTLWLNIGDSYAAAGKKRSKEQACRKSTLKGSMTGQISCQNQGSKITGNLKPKDLIGIPWMIAFALRDAGWYLRQDIIWSKPNPMPESVNDRCTKSHEYIFLFSKSKRYYYDADAIKVPVSETTITRMNQQIENQKGSQRQPNRQDRPMKAVGPGKKVREGVDISGGNQGSDHGIPAMAINGNGVKGHSGYLDANGKLMGGGFANKRSVWTVTTQPFKEAHFATFPPDLIVDCIKAGCPVGGIVLDPFMGAGTTALVAKRNDRNYIGIELNPAFKKIQDRRLHKELGLFK